MSVDVLRRFLTPSSPLPHPFLPKSWLRRKGKEINSRESFSATTNQTETLTDVIHQAERDIAAIREMQLDISASSRTLQCFILSVKEAALQDGNLRK